MKLPADKTADILNNHTDDAILLRSNWTGIFVVLGCLLIVLVLSWQLHQQTKSLNAAPLSKSVANYEEILDQGIIGQELAVSFALEDDVQYFRTKRSQSLVSARLFIQSIAILAGFALLMMGSSFVFARIRTDNENKAGFTYDNMSAYIGSYSPGLVLAAMGTTIIIATLIVSLFTKIKTTDLPLFFDPPALILTPVIDDRNFKVLTDVEKQKIYEEGLAKIKEALNKT